MKMGLMNGLTLDGLIYDEIIAFQANDVKLEMKME